MGTVHLPHGGIVDLGPESCPETHDGYCTKYLPTYDMPCEQTGQYKFEFWGRMTDLSGNLLQASNVVSYKVTWEGGC